MSDPARRQAELDALREQQIANTNAKALKGSALPINMEDWNAQQKLLKEAERQKKSDSAAILHNYNGVTDMSAVTKLKEEDRAKQLLAQKQLHDYRDRFVGTGKRWKSQEKIQVDAGGTQEQDVAAGISVSETAANFNYTPTEVAPPVPAAGQADGIVLVEKPEDSLTEPMVMVQDKSPIDSDASPKDGSQGSQEWVAVPTPEQPTEEEWGQMTMKHDNFGAPVQKTLSTVNVDFTFALLTEFETPDVDKYMKAAAFVVGDAVCGEGFVKSMNQHPSDRPGVRKFVVTATLPSVIRSGHTSDESRKHVLGLLKTSVQDGTFYSIALS